MQASLTPGFARFARGAAWFGWTAPDWKSCPPQQEITPLDQPLFQRLLGDGSQFGVSFQYAAQPRPEGLAQAFVIGEQFVGSEKVCLILGDNIYYASGLIKRLELAHARQVGATVFGYSVDNPSQYGVLKFDETGAIVDLIEKPKSYIITRWKR